VQQTLLKPKQDASIRLYAVWSNFYPGDARERWRPSLLADARVIHFWDEPQSVGRVFFNALPRLAPRTAPETIEIDGDALWDAYLLYGRDAHWDTNDRPPEVISWGATILVTKETLQRELANLLARPSGQ
jgi:hypothetical protein